MNNIRTIRLIYDNNGRLININNVQMFCNAFGFYNLEILLPTTINKTNKSIVKIGRIVTDALGNTTFDRKNTFAMLYTTIEVVNNVEYYVFYLPMPSTFISTVGDLEICGNYLDIVDSVQPDGSIKAIGVSRLTLEPFKTTVANSLILSEDVEFDVNSSYIAQINANTLAIQLVWDEIQSIYVINNDLQTQIDKNKEIAHDELEAAAKALEKAINDMGALLKLYTDDEISKHNSDKLSHTFILNWLQRLQDLINSGGGGGIKIPPYNTYIDGTTGHAWTQVSRQYEFVIENATHLLGVNVWVEFKNEKDDVVYINHKVKDNGDIYILSDIDLNVSINIIQM